MCAKSRRILVAVSIVIMSGFEFSCSSSNAPPQAEKGTPAFYWAAAGETFAANDFVKTSENLDAILKSENEYTARAQALLLVLTSGMIRGYAEVADSLETGVRVKKADPGGYRRYISSSRSTAGKLSLEFAETFMKFQKGKDDPIVLGFRFPSGSSAPVPELTRAMQGMALMPEEIEAAQRRAMQRGVLAETSRVVGAPDDTAKATDLFKSGSAQVPRATFMEGMANSLYEQSQLYTPRKLDDPTKVKVFSDLASEALKSVPESKQTKELADKIKKATKK
jgi:hypothetical protein